MTTPDQVYKTTIETTPEKLWAAITNPEFTKQYWFGNANVSSWEKGAAWEHKNPETGEIFHIGKVVEIKPLEKLVLSWHNPGDETDVSKVTFDIKHSGGVCELQIIHGDFIDDSGMAKRVSGGWPKVVANLKVFLEQGGAADKHATCGCAH
jgi:uncharacterized protein YndB with AHSA1/START domain